jgi:hypothetical protein
MKTVFLCLKVGKLVCSLFVLCSVRHPRFWSSEPPLLFCWPVNQKSLKTTGVIVFVYYDSSKQSSQECKKSCNCDLLDQRCQSLFILTDCSRSDQRFVNMRPHDRPTSTLTGVLIFVGLCIEGLTSWLP